VIAIGQLQLILGPKRSRIKPQTKKEMILIMTKRMVLIQLDLQEMKSHMVTLRKALLPKKDVKSVLVNHSSFLVNKSHRRCPGRSFLQMIFQKLWIGEIRMESTIFHGLQTSTFQSIVVHAGLKLQLRQLQIDSIFNSINNLLLLLHSVLKLLLTAKKEEIVQEEKEGQSTNGPSSTVFLTHLVRTMRLTMEEASAKLLTFARIVLEKYAQLEKPVKKIASQLNIKDIMYLHTIKLLEKIK